jgi:hypothetical protein
VCGAVAVAHRVPLVVTTQDQAQRQQPPTARGRQLDLAGCGRSAGGRGRVPWATVPAARAAGCTGCAGGVSDYSSSTGRGFNPASSSSSAALRAPCLAVWACTAPSAPGAARLASWITRRRSVLYVGTVELRLEDWWLSLPLSRSPLTVVDGRLLGGTGWQVAAVRVRVSSLFLSRARAAWFALRGCACDRTFYCSPTTMPVALARLVKPWCSSKTITCDWHKLKRRIPLTRCGP